MMDWVLSHWDIILGVATAVLSLASVVTKLTVTPVDDGVVAALQKLLGWLSTLNHKDVGGAKAPLTRPKILPFEREDLLRERGKF